MAFVEEIDRDGLRLRELTIELHDRNVTGVLWQNPGADAGAPLVCFGHGASGDRFQQPIPWLAERLVGNHGFAALAIDGPVHGRRKVGGGGRDEFWPEWKRPETVTRMNADWKAALDFVQAQPDIGTGPVGYWGLSMGTIYGTPFTATDERIVVAVLGLMGISGPDHYRPTITAAAEAIDIPVLFLMQLEDELFPRDEYLALFDALASTDKRLHANPGLHPDVPMEELHTCVEFLVAGLSGEPSAGGSAFAVST